MDNKGNPIADFDIDLVADFFKDMPRQSPGSEEQTRKALGLLGNANFGKGTRIADLGCGTGQQTIVLAQHTQGVIKAVDIMPQMMAALDVKLARYGFQDRVFCVEEAIDNLPFDDNRLDLIWSESSIHNMPFDHRLQQWRRHLKPHAHIVLTQVSWLHSYHRPPLGQIEYVHDVFPYMNTIQGNLQIMEQSGYQSVAHFVVPQQCWIDNYYKPMTKCFDRFLMKKQYSKPALKLVDELRKQVYHYWRNREYYGYVFYIGKKIS